MSRMAIIGLNTVGASLGMALLEAYAAEKGQGSTVSLVGYDPDPKVADTALARKAVKELAWGLEEAVREADLVIIAQAAPEVRQTLQEIAPHLRAGCIVTDTASTKVEVIEAAAELLPPGVHFVGGHPIPLPWQDVNWADGPRAARADLFEGGLYGIFPSRGAGGGAETVRGLAQAVGASPYFLDPYEHDGLWAGLSQTPFVVSVALLATVGGSQGWRDLKLLADPTLRRVGEVLAAAPAETFQGCTTNRQPLISWLDRVIAALGEVRRELATDSGGETLQKLVDQAHAAMEDWATHRDERDKELGRDSMKDVPSGRERFLGMFVPPGLQKRRR